MRNTRVSQAELTVSTEAKAKDALTEKTAIAWRSNYLTAGATIFGLTELALGKRAIRASCGAIISRQALPSA